MKYIAHRGASLIKQENTVESLVCGAELGAFAVECDIRVTADGRYIIFHDPDLSRIAGSDIRIKEKTFEEIAAVVREKAGYTPITIEDIAQRYHETTPILLHIKIPATDDLLDTLCRAPFPFICGIERADEVKKYRSFLPAERILSFIPSPDQAETFVKEGAGIIRLWEHWLDHIKPADVKAMNPDVQVWIMANRNGSMNGAPESLAYIRELGADGVLLNDIVMGLDWDRANPEPGTCTNPICEGADPFILLHDGKYYLYSTNAPDGYLVYESDDLAHWENKGYCLRKEDVKGDKWFWAPEIMHRGGKFYMVYTSEEHLGIAVADSPLGPFRQETKQWLSERNAIDGDFFTDDDGTTYLYYVRFAGGNVIHGAKLNPDFTLDETTERRLIEAQDDWETRDCLVTEGPFMLKHNGKYYLTYSANHFRSPDYAIGYAVSDSPLGPFTKYEGSPIFHKNKEVNGVGHHSFTTSKDGKQMICVYHRHNSLTAVQPRMTCVDRAEFVPSPNGAESDDILVIHGPTTSAQKLN